MTWIVEIELLLPLAQTSINENGGLPEKLQFKPIYNPISEPVEIKGVTFSLHEWDESREKTDTNGLMAFGRATLRVATDITDKNQMYSTVGELLDSVYDRFFFLLQSPVYTGKVWVTRPDGITDAHTSDFSFRSKSSTRNTTPMELGAESEWLTIDLISLETDKKIDRALHWYRKAIGERVTLDKFIYLWISLEIMCNRHGEKVEITSSCKGCGHESKREGIGETIKAYLTSYICISEKQAKDLWEIRHVVHGRSLSATQERELGQLTSLLHSCATNALKMSLNLDHTKRPLPPKQVMHFGGGIIRSGG